MVMMMRMLEMLKYDMVTIDYLNQLIALVQVLI
jgi:hypothetical protein